MDRKRMRVAYAAAVGVALLGARLQAADQFWNNPAGGDFAVAGNWLNSMPPATGDTANFNLDSNYTVTLSAPASVLQLLVDQDAVTLDLGGLALTGNSTGYAVPSLSVGESAGSMGALQLQNGSFSGTDVRIGDSGTGTLTLANATLSASDTLDMGFFAGSLGVLILNDSGSAFASGLQHIGENGNGILTISNGAVLVSTTTLAAGGASALGGSPGANGTVTISGQGSGWTGLQNDVWVGNGGRGVLTVSDLGALSSYGLTAGEAGTGTGLIQLSGATAAGRSEISTVSDALIGLAGEGTLSITSGALFSAGGNLQAGYDSGSVGYITVSGSAAGSASQLMVAGSLNLGNVGGSGYLSIGQDGEVSVAGATSIGGSGTGALVLSGGSLDTHGLLVLSGGSFAQNSGTLVIDHGLYQPAAGALSLVGSGAGTTANLQLINGATLAQSGALYVGGSTNVAGPGVGILDIASGAQVNFSGLTKIWSGGTVNLSGGALTTSSLTLSGGAFHFDSGSLTLTSANFELGAAGLLGNNLVLLSAAGSRNLFSASGTVTLDAGSSLAVSGGTFSAGSVVNNGGAITFTAGAIALTNSNLTLDTGALLGSSVDLPGGKSLSVSGTVTINAGASLAIDGGIFLAGAVVNNGSFAFNSGTVGNPGDLIIDAGQLLGSSVTLSAGQSITAGQGLIVGKTGGGTLVLNGGQATSLRGYVGQLAGSHGVLTLSGAGTSVEVTNTFVAGGSDSGIGGTASISILSGASLLAGSTVTLFASARVMVDSGTLGGSTIIDKGGLTLEDNALIMGNLSSSSVITTSGIGDVVITGTLSSTSAVQVTGGTLTLDYGAGKSSGSFNISAGAELEFRGGNIVSSTSSLSATSVVAGLGTVLFTSGAHVFGGTFNVSNVTVDNGEAELTSNATIGTLTLAATLGTSYGVYTSRVLAVQSIDFTGGVLGGTGTVTISGPLDFTGPGNKSLFQGTFNAGGYTLWTGESNVGGINLTTFNNLAAGTFEAQSSSLAEPADFGASIFNNAGAFVKSTGQGAIEIGGIFNNSGSVHLEQGELLFEGGGTQTGSFTSDAGTTLTFGAQSSSSTTFSATGSLVAGGNVLISDQNFEFSGLYDVSGNATLSGSVSFLVGASVQSLGTAVTISGTATFATGNPLTLPATTLSGFLLGGDTLSTSAPFTWSPQSFDSTIGTHLILNGTSTFTESGTYLKNLSGTLDNNGYITWINGTIVQTGTFNNFSGATFEIQGQDALEINFSQQNPLPEFNNMGTVLKSAGNTTDVYPAFSNSGLVEVNAGQLIFARNSDSTGSYMVAQNATVGFVFGTHTLESTSSVSGAGNVVFDGDTISLLGTINITGSTTMGSQTDSNPAQITASPGATLTNLGNTLTIWNNATFTSGTGSDLVLDNLVLWGKLNGSDRVVINGTLSGRGSITAPTVNAGEVSPGASPGTLMINGDYFQEPSASLLIELAPAGDVGTKYIQQFDVLRVSGTAHLAGVLNLVELDGFVPDLGATFQVLTYSAYTGQFDTVVGAQLPGNLAYQVDYGAAGVTLQVVSVPEAASLALLAPAVLLLGRRRRRV